MKKDNKEIVLKVYNFLNKRMNNIFVEEDFEKDTVSSVLKTNDDNILSIKEKIKAFASLKKKKNFEELAGTFKRVSNIIKKETIKLSKIDLKLLKEKEEKKLYAKFIDIKKESLKKIKRKEYEKALFEIAKLKPFVDNFFDNVMVMTKNKKIKTNRLLLLKEITMLFEIFAKWN